MTPSHSTTRTLSDAFDDLRSQANAAAKDARRDFRETARELPYAMLGSVQFGFRRGRRAFRQLFELPGQALDRARQAPEALREGYRERVEAGHELFERTRGRKSVRTARKQTRAARSSARRATSQAGSAARAGARAVSDAASSLDATDTRPFEERTVEELYELAAEREIDGRSQMNKSQLIRALRAAR